MCLSIVRNSPTLPGNRSKDLQVILKPQFELRVALLGNLHDHLLRKSEVAICKRFKTCEEVLDRQAQGLIMLITARDAIKTELARIISLILAYSILFSKLMALV